MRARRRVVKATRKAIDRGEAAVFRVDVDRRTVTEMPWLEFDGNGPPAVAEAARRAIAAELAVRPAQIVLEVQGSGDRDGDGRGSGQTVARPEP
jgi:hypothetical protein